MNEISIQQWLSGLRTNLVQKGAQVLWTKLECNGWNGQPFQWKIQIGIEAKPTDSFVSDDKDTPEDALIAAGEWVSAWMHPDKKLALVLGIEQPDTMVEEVTDVPF